MPKKVQPEAYTKPWTWQFPNVHIKSPFPTVKRVFVFLFRGKAKVIRRMSFVLFILLYVPFLTWLRLGPDALKPIPDTLSSVTEPESIQGEKDQYLIAHIYNNVFFRVVGANKFWRIFHECQDHVVTGMSGNVIRTECQHPDNWVSTNENEWHRYTLRYEESIRVIYTPGARIELRVVAPDQGLTPVSVTIFRFLYVIIFILMYGVLNMDAIPNIDLAA